MVYTGFWSRNGRRINPVAVRLRLAPTGAMAGYVLMNSLPANAQDPSGRAGCDTQMVQSVKRRRSRSRGRSAEPTADRSLALSGSDGLGSCRWRADESAVPLVLRENVARRLTENVALRGVYGQGSVQGAPDSLYHAERQLQVAVRGDPSGRCDDLSVPGRCTASPSNRLALVDGTPAALPVGSTIGQLRLADIAPDS